MHRAPTSGEILLSLSNIYGNSKDGCITLTLSCTGILACTSVRSKGLHVYKEAHTKLGRNSSCPAAFLSCCCPVIIGKPAAMWILMLILFFLVYAWFPSRCLPNHFVFSLSSAIANPGEEWREIWTVGHVGSISVCRMILFQLLWLSLPCVWQKYPSPSSPWHVSICSCMIPDSISQDRFKTVLAKITGL